MPWLKGAEFSQVFEKNGTFRYQFGVPGKEEGQLWYPRKVSSQRKHCRVGAALSGWSREPEKTGGSGYGSCSSWADPTIFCLSLMFFFKDLPGTGTAHLGLGFNTLFVQYRYYISGMKHVEYFFLNYFEMNMRVLRTHLHFDLLCRIRQLRTTLLFVFCLKVL